MVSWAAPFLLRKKLIQQNILKSTHKNINSFTLIFKWFLANRHMYYLGFSSKFYIMKLLLFWNKYPTGLIISNQSLQYARPYIMLSHLILPILRLWKYRLMLKAIEKFGLTTASGKAGNKGRPKSKVPSLCATILFLPLYKQLDSLWFINCLASLVKVSQFLRARSLPVELRQLSFWTCSMKNRQELDPHPHYPPRGVGNTKGVALYNLSISCLGRRVNYIFY